MPADPARISRRPVSFRFDAVAKRPPKRVSCRVSRPSLPLPCPIHANRGLLRSARTCPAHFLIRASEWLLHTAANRSADGRCWRRALGGEPLQHRRSPLTNAESKAPLDLKSDNKIDPNTLVAFQVRSFRRSGATAAIAKSKGKAG